MFCWKACLPRQETAGRSVLPMVDNARAEMYIPENTHLSSP